MLVNIKGQSFDLDASILNGILEAMGQTAIDHVEHGFSLCQTPTNKLMPGKKCVGKACWIHLEPCTPEEGIPAGSFHSHPDVISFSTADYVMDSIKAKNHPDNKALMCVALEDQGVRCKAQIKQPPNDKLNLLQKYIEHKIDNEHTRGIIKPFWTERVDVGTDTINKLLAGESWDSIPPSEKICAIDEGPEQMVGNITCAKEEITMAKTLMQVAQEYIKEPTGQYPWETKKVTKSIKTEGGVGIESAGMPDLISMETKFIRTTDVEIPDPDLIHIGEVAGYIAALSPIILTDTKDKDGKYKIHDGRHRLAAWRAAGYKQIPVVFTHEVEYKPK